MSWFYYLDADADRCHHALAQLTGIADEYGHAPLRSYAGTIGTLLESIHGNVSDAEPWIREVRNRAGEASPFDRSAQLAVLSWHAAVLGNYADAVEFGLESLPLVERAGCAAHWVMWSLVLVYVYEDSHRSEEADAWIVRLRAYLARKHLHCYDTLLLAAEAWRALGAQRRGPCRAALQRMFAHVEGGHWEYVLPWYGKWMPTLCHEALREGVEVTYVKALIRRYRWRGKQAWADWPWPVRIRTLGRFAVEVEDRALTFPKKVPRKPLALLQTLIALGGRHVPTAKLVNCLWPHVDADTGEQAFRTNLHRLRELLGVPGALMLADGKLSLDDGVVWVDLFALDRLLADTGRGLVTPEVRQRALELYQGEFLAGERDQSWTLPVRTRWRVRMSGLATDVPASS